MIGMSHLKNQVNMVLIVSQKDQTFEVGDTEFKIADGEAILTEYSHKYSVRGFEQMAAQVRWQPKEVWTDPRDYFAVMYLEK